MKNANIRNVAIIACTQLVLFVMICTASAQTTGQDVRQLTSIAQRNYADENVDLYVGGSDVSLVNGHIFQAVLVKSNDGKPVYDYYVWELTPDGEKVQEWLIRTGISTLAPIPLYVVPCLRVLPDGNILSVIAEAPGNPQIVSFDVHGAMIIAKPLTEHERLDPIFTSIIPAGDGQSFVLGKIRMKPIIVKIDNQGQIVFKKEIAMDGGGHLLGRGAAI